MEALAIKQPRFKLLSNLTKEFLSRVQSSMLQKPTGVISNI
jgi:hypothetical protein